MAQLRWDVGARIGGGKRFLGSQPDGASNTGAGPAAELSLHTALFPLLRIGPSVSAEFSPVGGRPIRRHYGVGLEARAFAPLPWPKFRPFVYFGARYVTARQPETEAFAAGGGHYVSFPFGVGASIYMVKFVRMVATFGGDGAVGHSGSLYDPTRAVYVGNDTMGLRGLLGVDLEF